MQYCDASGQNNQKRGGHKKISVICGAYSSHISNLYLIRYARAFFSSVFYQIKKALCHTKNFLGRQLKCLKLNIFASKMDISASGNLPIQTLFIEINRLLSTFPRRGLLNLLAATRKLFILTKLYS